MIDENKSVVDEIENEDVTLNETKLVENEDITLKEAELTENENNEEVILNNNINYLDPEILNVKTYSLDDANDLSNTEESENVYDEEVYNNMEISNISEICKELNIRWFNVSFDLSEESGKNIL